MGVNAELPILGGVDTLQAIRERPDLEGVAIDHADICLKNWRGQTDNEKCDDATHFSCDPSGMDFDTTSSYNTPMARMQNISLRRRGFIGALIGAAIPYGLGAYENGFVLGGDVDGLIIFGGLCLFFGLLGAGVATNNFGQGPSANGRLDSDSLDQSGSWADYDRDRSEFHHQSGNYAYMRDAWDPNYQRNSWD